MTLQENLKTAASKKQKAFAVLLDPDKVTLESASKIIRLAVESKVDYFLVGGSLITNESLGEIIRLVKEESNIPAIIFPGSNLHIYPKADGILLLSLISGRNPEYLIGQHVAAAPLLKRSGIEILPTGYILVDCGRQTTVSYISNTTPVPFDKPEVAACTALAGEMLGLKLIYLDGGSGALKPIAPEMISKVKSSIEVPLIVGGGISSPEKATVALKAGADMIVVGNAIEKEPSLLVEISDRVAEINSYSSKTKS